MTTSSQAQTQTSVFSQSFENLWKKRLEYILCYGRNSGADFVEVFLENTDHLGLLAEQDEITSITPSFTSGAGIRVFKGTKDGFVSTNDITENGLKIALEDALSMLGLEGIQNSSLSFDGLKQLKDFGKYKNNWISESPRMQQATEKVLEATNDLKKTYKDLKVRRCTYSRSWQEVLIASSDGTFARDIRLYQTTGLNVLAANKQNRSSISRRYGTSSKPCDLQDWDTEKSALDICESAKKMLDAKYVEAGQMPAVLANKFGGVIFHEACGHLLETTQIERGTSPFADKLNKQIANVALSAKDEGITNSAFGSLSIDDEGMPPQNTILIKDGILKHFISDRAGELRTGYPRTGSGRRQNYSFAAASRMRNTYICPGNFYPHEIIQSIDNGLYCKSMGGGSVGPTGQFNFSVEEGYLIRNGQLSTPVKGATLIGEAKEILPRISMCGNDMELAPGFCGSISGNVNVTVGQPHIKVDSITVGGR